MAPPHVPTAAQLTQLATLQAAEATAMANYTANVTATKSAQVAWLNAQAASAAYQSYIYGGQKAGIIDEGSQNTV